jgi:hypothetical protein
LGKSPCFDLSKYASNLNRLQHHLTSGSQYHPTAPVQNAVTAIFHSESAAQTALEKANHRYGLIIEPVQPVTSFVGPPIPPLESEYALEGTATGNEAEEKQEVKEFQLDFYPSDFVHERYIKSPVTNPLYGPFKPVLPAHSFIVAALKQTVPPSLWATGLRDWETDAARRTRGVAGLEADLNGRENESGPEGHFLGVRSAYQARHRRRQIRSVPTVMKGLKALKEERQKRDKDVEALRKTVG